MTGQIQLIMVNLVLNTEIVRILLIFRFKSMLKAQSINIIVLVKYLVTRQRNSTIQATSQANS